MNRLDRTIRVVLFITLSAVVIAAPIAADAVAEDVQGLVQYRTPGNDTWLQLTSGTALPEGSTLISGTDGRARLEAGNSTIDLAPLSRIVVRTIDVSPSAERTELSMPYGRVDARVRRARDRGMDFSVYTPISTAAVRGTEFVFDGRSLAVQKGDVALFNTLGQEHSVRAGQLSRVWADEPIQSVEATLAEELAF